MRADLSTQKTSNVRILKMSLSVASAAADASLDANALDLLALAAVACFAAGLKDIHLKVLEGLVVFPSSEGFVIQQLHTKAV